MMNEDYKQTQESVSADTNGLGSVVLQLHGTGQLIHMTSCQAKALAIQLQEKAVAADSQNSAL